MGRKNIKKKKSAKRQSKNQSGNKGSNNNPPAFIPSEELISSLECLTTATTGTAEDHGLLGDCPYCLESLPNFWNDDGDLEENYRFFFPCCGKSCCSCCRHKVFSERLLPSSLANFRKRYPSRNDALAFAPSAFGKKYNEWAFASSLVENLHELTSKQDMQLWRQCPFCRFPTFQNDGYRISDATMVLLSENAESGHAWAQYFLAVEYLDHEESKNEQKRQLAIEFLHSSVLKGYAPSTYKLSKLYFEGSNGVKKSTKLGEILLDLATQQGHGFAAGTLHAIYDERGEYRKAFEYAQIGSDLGCYECSRWIVGVYSGSCEENYGVEEDGDMAFEYAKRAADQGGDAGCQYVTALEYDEIGDEAKAVEYLQLSVDQGYAEAQCVLGSKYVSDGECWMFSSENWTAGVQLLRRARDGGIDEAVEILKGIESAIKENCFNCGAEVDGTGAKKFNTCAKCKTVCYCSKDCQIEAWKAGHKDVCVKYDG